MVINKWRQGWLSEGITNFSDPVYILLPQDFCFAAEIGLAGEIRQVNRVEQRILEAEKLGFQKVFISKSIERIADHAKNLAEEVIYLLEGAK